MLILSYFQKCLQKNSENIAKEIQKISIRTELTLQIIFIVLKLLCEIYLPLSISNKAAKLTVSAAAIEHSNASEVRNIADCLLLKPNDQWRGCIYKKQKSRLLCK